MISVFFFAQLREQLGVTRVDVPAKNIETLIELRAYLLLQNPYWETTLGSSKILTAVNHSYVKGDCRLMDGDEVAFFPPVTGG